MIMRLAVQAQATPKIRSRHVRVHCDSLSYTVETCGTKVSCWFASSRRKQTRCKTYRANFQHNLVLAYRLVSSLRQPDDEGKSLGLPGQLHAEGVPDGYHSLGAEHWLDGAKLRGIQDDQADVSTCVDH